MYSILTRRLVAFSSKSYRPVRPLLAQENRLFSQELPQVPRTPFYFYPAMASFANNFLTGWSLTNSLVFSGCLVAGWVLRSQLLYLDSARIYGITCDRNFEYITFQLASPLRTRGAEIYDQDLQRYLLRVHLKDIVDVCNVKDQAVQTFEEVMDKQLFVTVRVPPVQKSTQASTPSFPQTPQAQTKQDNLIRLSIDLNENLNKGQADYLMALLTFTQVQLR